jgi:hypothetical protein
MKKILLTLLFLGVVSVGSDRAYAYQITWYCACCNGGDTCASTTAGGCQNYYGENSCSDTGQTVSADHNSSDVHLSCGCPSRPDYDGDEYEHLIKVKDKILDGHRSQKK